MASTGFRARATRLLELTNAANVCVRFRRHAKIAFDSIFKSELTFFSVHEFANRPNDAREMLRIFGPQIQSIGITTERFGPSDGETLKLINNHTASTLKKLHLNHFYFHEDAKPFIHLLFARVQELTLENCHFNNSLQSLITVCDNLTILKLNKNQKWCIDHQFAHLREVKFRSAGYDAATLKRFFLLNPTIQTLEIGDWCTWDVLSSIGRNLPHLVELDIFAKTDRFVDCVFYLGLLKSLKVLKIRFALSEPKVISYLAKAFTKQKMSIEVLRIVGGKMDLDARKSLTIKSIKTLELREVSDITNMDLTELAKRLPDLEVLRLACSKVKINPKGINKILLHAPKLRYLLLISLQRICIIKNDDYQEMLRTVQSRPEEIPLQIAFNFRLSVNVPKEIQTKNRKWLRFGFYPNITTISIEKPNFREVP